MATDNDTSFDAALAALDVEPTHHTDRMVTTYDILGLDAVRAAHRAEVDALNERLAHLTGANETPTMERDDSWMDAATPDALRQALKDSYDMDRSHHVKRERAVAEERDRNLDVLADFYSKTRAGRYASLSKEARQARLDVLTHAYSRMGGGLIHERADELDRQEPLEENATGGSNVG